MVTVFMLDVMETEKAEIVALRFGDLQNIKVGACGATALYESVGRRKN